MKFIAYLFITILFLPVFALLNIYNIIFWSLGMHDFIALGKIEIGKKWYLPITWSES